MNHQQRLSAKHKQIFQQAVFLQQNGRLNEAAGQFAMLLKVYPKQVQLLTALGTIAFQQGELAQAAMYFANSLLAAANQPCPVLSGNCLRANQPPA